MKCCYGVMAVCLFVSLDSSLLLNESVAPEKCVTTEQQMSGRWCMMGYSSWALQPMHKIWMTKYEHSLSARQACSIYTQQHILRPNNQLQFIKLQNLLQHVKAQVWKIHTQVISERILSCKSPFRQSETNLFKMEQHISLYLIYLPRWCCN